MIFDREGYSPALMLRLKTKQIACITYHKHPGDNWPETEFTKQPVNLVTGEAVEMALAERGTWLGGKLWVREIRKLTETGHQTFNYCHPLCDGFYQDCSRHVRQMVAGKLLSNYAPTL